VTILPDSTHPCERDEKYRWIRPCHISQCSFSKCRHVIRFGKSPASGIGLMHVGKASTFSGALLKVVYKVDFVISAGGFRLGRYSAKYLEASYCFGELGSGYTDNHVPTRDDAAADKSKHLYKGLGKNRLRNRENIEVPAFETVILTSPATCCTPLEAHVQRPPQPVCQLRDCNFDRHHLGFNTCRVTGCAWISGWLAGWLHLGLGGFIKTREKWTCNRYMYSARIGANLDQARNNVPSLSPG
jgi:hypothetical protein